MRTLTAVLAAACLGGCVVAQEAAETRWAEYAHLARRLDAVAPTPAGESHIGEVKAGQAVALRFPVPAEPVLGYWLSLGNIVAYSGRGSSYQLVLHRDTPDGPVLYTGPVIVNGDAWNWQNLQPIDVSDGILAADRARGYLEVQATALVQGDGWTIYRHRPPQPVFAMATLETPELRQQALAGRAMRERGVALVPVPQQIEFTAGALRLGPETRIVFPADQGPDLAGAAAELMLLIRERTGLELKVVPVTQPASAGDLALATRACAWPRVAALAAAAPAGGLAPEGYVLEVGPQGALVVGTDPAGCFYGAMSLGQMTQPAGPGAQLQACLIRDWPAFPQRIIQYDVARGQTIEVDYVKRMIRELARCKVNGLLFYMEDDFRFRAYPFCGREGTFTHEKARALAEFARMGFISGTYTRVGEWNPAQMNEQFVPIRFDVTAALKAAGPVEVEWTYTAGAHALAIRSTQILCDGAVVAEDVHPGNTGASNRGNVYTLSLAEVRPGARYELLGEVAARGGTDSNGIVWLVTADGSAR